MDWMLFFILIYFLPENVFEKIVFHAMEITEWNVYLQLMN